MVVGPQQHWLHINQGVFREWWFEDSMRERMAAANAAAAQINGVTAAQSQPATPSRPMQKLRGNASSQLQLSTPPNNGNAVTNSSSSNNNNNNNNKRSALGEIHANDQGNPHPLNNNNNNSNSTVNTPLAKTGNIITTTGTTGTTSTIANDENLPAPTPGQPRKSIRKNTSSRHSSHQQHQQQQQRVSSLSTYNHNNYNPNPKPSASTSTPTDEEIEAEAEASAADREPVTLQGRMHRRESETDEDFYLRLLSRRGASKTPGGTDVAGLMGTGRRRTSSRTMGTTTGTGTGTVTAATAGGTQRRREREKRRTASGMAEITASPIRGGGTWGIAVDHVEGMLDIGAGATNESVNGSTGNCTTISGAGGIASWKTRTSANNIATVGTTVAAAAGVAGSGVRKTSRRIGSYGSVVWAK